MTRFASPFYWGEHDDPAYVRSAAYLIGTEIRDLGFNVNFAPVLDLYPRPDHSIIGDRSMGDDPEKIAVFARNYIEGARNAGIIAVAKHFPGHGVTTVDSHLRLPSVALSREDLLSSSFVPFRAAVESGIEAIMTSHVVFSAFDPDHPATLSKTLVSDILRTGFGFEGVVVSDAIEMGALRSYFGIDQVLVQAFGAGVDVILVSGFYRIEDLIDRTIGLIRNGEIEERELDRGALRVLALKRKYGLLG
jgi:beta-N-acetylhexosaminidase